MLTRHISLALCTGAVLALCVPAVAQAAPVTVNLRVEGSATTLYEGPISTEGETFETLSTHGESHSCDYSDNGHSEFEGEVFTNGGAQSGTPTTALRDAALASSQEFNAIWSTSLGDFFVTQFGSDKEQGEAAWGFAVNYTTAPVGGCQIRLAPGNEVLWAYNYFNLKHLLSLTSPSSANVGSPITLHVVDGQTGASIAGAAIGEDVAGVTTTIPGSPLTNAEGNVTITFAHAGTVKLKATQPESVRSNAISVCVHNGNDGTCGTTAPGVLGVKDAPGTVNVTPVPGATATVGGVKNGHHYSRRKGPRILQGLVQLATGGTLREVRISLRRLNGKHCTVFSGTKETFVRARCGAARFFSVGDSESFSYLLPASLPPGRYVYDIEAIDGTGKPTRLVPGVSHVVFYVK
jgi:hypothetical protein